MNIDFLSGNPFIKLNNDEVKTIIRQGDVRLWVRQGDVSFVLSF